MADFCRKTCFSAEPSQNIIIIRLGKDGKYMKATGIVRRIDDLGRVVIPKEIRRTMRIREGDPLLTTITHAELIIGLAERLGNT